MPFAFFSIANTIISLDMSRRTRNNVTVKQTISVVVYMYIFISRLQKSDLWKSPAEQIVNK